MQFTGILGTPGQLQAGIASAFSHYSFTNRLGRPLIVIPGFIYPTYSINQTLSLNQSLSIFTSDIHSINDTLTFTQTIRLPVTYSYSLSNTLSFNQTISKTRVQYRLILDSFSLNQTISKNDIHSFHLIHSLPFNQTVSRNIIYNFSFLDHLTFLDNFLMPLNYKQIIQVPNIRYSIINKHKQYLSLISNGENILLPPPLLNNTFTNSNQVNIKKTMTNLVYTYIKTNPFIKLNYTFSLNRTQANALGKFYLNNSHRQITLIDWNYQQFVGFFTIDPLVITENRNYDNQIELEFQGIKL